MIPFIADPPTEVQMAVLGVPEAADAGGRQKDRMIHSPLGEEAGTSATFSLWRTIAARAVDTPEAPFVIEADGLTYTYTRAHELTTQWGIALRSAGMDARLVAVLPNQAALHLLRVASGHVGLPFGAVNPLLRGPMLADALLRISATDVVVSPDTADQVVEVLGLLPGTLRVHMLDGDELKVSSRARAKAAARFDADPDPDYALSIVYTSGTSGPAKPVLLSGTAVNYYAGTLFDDAERSWTPGAGYYSPWHPAHILGAVALDAAARRGLTLVLRRRFDMQQFSSDVERYDCRLTVLISVAADVWAARRPEQQENPLELVGMAPLIASFGEFERYFGVQVLSIYGMTELGAVLVARSPESSRVTGRPVPGYECRLEPVSGFTTPGGNVGELLVRPAVRRSEYDVAGGQVVGGWTDGWFHTGDLFVEVDGSYGFLGRIKHCIRLRGRNISAADLEAQIREIPEIFDCVCIGVSDTGDQTGPPGDDADIRLFIQPYPDTVVDVEAIVEQLQHRLPHFMLPRYFDVVEQLPRTPTGKLLRGPLRQLPLGQQTHDRKTALCIEW